jgi:hypothetical protein
MNLSPEFLHSLAVDVADAAQFVAALTADDSWEWQRHLDGIQTADEARRLIGALSGLHVGLIQEICGHFGTDPVAYAEHVAKEKRAEADAMRPATE